MKYIIILAIFFNANIYAQSPSDWFFHWLEDLEAPAAPTSPSALGSAGAVAVSWTDPTALDFDSVRVYAGTSTAPTTWIASVAKGTQTYNYTGLTPGGTIYYFRLKAKDQTGNLSAYTSTVQDTVLPVVPTIAVVGDSGKITITNTAIIADSLRIYRGTSANPTTWVYSIAANTTKIDTPLTYNTVYHYRAKALTGSTLSDYSTSVNDTALIALGAELCGNVTFDADEWWSKEATVTISGGTAVYTNSTPYKALYKNSFLTIGKTYRTEFDFVSLGAEGSYFQNWNGGIFKGGVAAYSEHITYTWTAEDANFSLYGWSGFTGTVDNVTIKEVLNP